MNPSHRATRAMRRSIAASAAAMVAALAYPAAAQTITPEVEPNESRTTASTSALPLVQGDALSGTTTGSVTTAGATSVDFWKVRVAPDAPGIYRYRLLVGTAGAVGHTLTLRGLSTTSPTQAPWLPAQAVGTVGTGDAAIQTSSSSTNPARFCQWYGFGKGEELFARVAGTSTTTGQYFLTFQKEVVTATNIAGDFPTGDITISAIGLGHTTDTDFWVYDSNFNPIRGYGNDDNTAAAISGVPEATGTGFTGAMKRNFAPGTYYLAISNWPSANNQASASDDRASGPSVADLPHYMSCSSTTANVNLAFKISGGAVSVTVPNTKVGPYDVNFFRFVVTNVVPPYDPCAAFNPTLSGGSNSLPLNQDTAADLTVNGMTIRKANYFKFTPAFTAPFTFSTCASGAATRMAVLSDCAPGATVLASDDNGCGGSSAVVTVPLTAGTPVYVVVGGESADLPSPLGIVVDYPGTSCANPWIAGYGENSILSAPYSGQSQAVFTNAAQSTTQTVNKRQWLAFTPTATGTFEFRFCGGTVGDTLLALGTTCPAAGAAFGTIAYDDDSACGTGSILDASADLPLAQNLIAGTTYYICVGGWSTSWTGTGSLTISGPAGGPYDPCATANPVLVSGNNLPVIRSDATVADLVVGSMTIRKANYLKFTPAVDGAWTFSTCTSGAATRMAVLSDCVAGATVLGSDDNGCGGSSTSSRLSVNLTASQAVYVVVGGEDADLPAEVAVRVDGPPVAACAAATLAVYGDNPISSTANAGTNQNVFANAGQSTADTVFNAQWFKFRPTATGAFTFKTCNAGDTKLAIGTACPSFGATFSTIAYNDDAPTCLTGPGGQAWASWIDGTNNGATGIGAGFPLTQNLERGQEYLICVGGYGATTVIAGNLVIDGPQAPPCPADLNGTGQVNGDDLGLLLVAWGPCSGACAADLTNDGQVNGDDLGFLLVAWGACP